MKQLPTTLSVSFILLVGLSFGECCGVTSDSARKADFYVSADGSDDWSGLLPESNAQGTDGPFASLERARQAVWDLKKRTSTDI
ncbi:MAG: right-handed parallel beta-helix repeat-containing protein, partial [Planctomycetota bacterium]